MRRRVCLVCCRVGVCGCLSVRARAYECVRERECVCGCVNVWVGGVRGRVGMCVHEWVCECVWARLRVRVGVCASVGL